MCSNSTVNHYANFIRSSALIQVTFDRPELRVGAGSCLSSDLGCLPGQATRSTRCWAAIGSACSGRGVDAPLSLALSQDVVPGNFRRLLRRAFLWRMGSLFPYLQLLGMIGIVPH